MRTVDAMTSSSTAPPPLAPTAPAPTGPATSPPERSSRPRLALLDGLRFVAALAVVSYHLAGRTTTAWGPDQAERLGDVPRWTSYGSLGPELFFVISGFVVLMTAWGRPTAQVVASRVARLMPAYWAGVLLTGGLLLVVWPEGKDVSLQQVVVNLTMLQSAVGVPHVDGVYWTLWAELRFYLLIGVLSLVGITRRRVLGFALLWPIAGQAAVHAGHDGLATLLVADYAPLFAVGMALYLIYREGHGVAEWAVVGVHSALAVWLVVPSRVAVLERTTGHEPSSLLLTAGVFACVAAVAVVTLTPLARVRGSWLVTLGALTYPLYVVHTYLGLAVVRALAPAVPAVLALAAAGAVVLGAAWVVHRVVEVPTGPRLRRGVEGVLVRARGVVLDRVNRGPRLVRAVQDARLPV